MSQTPQERDPFEVVAESFLTRYRAGERPALSEYIRQHPELSEQIRKLFPALLEIEQLRPFVLGLSAGQPSPTLSLRLAEPNGQRPIRSSPSEQVPAPAAIPSRYQLFGEIARGGMGAVLHGHDKDLGRDLAVKVLLGEHTGRPQILRRFITEAQIGGQLQHPGIVPVYELGRFGDQRPYFTMKLVQGRTLAALLAERTEPTQERPRLFGIFQQVCQTLAYAHARGVVHRDLKPSNVMVGTFGEVQVMDWGLAKVLAKGEGDAAKPAPDDTGIERTQRARTRSSGLESETGMVLGTPPYMAPEQARGEVERLDQRVDVFGLGAILCEILTGQPPYTGPSRDEIRSKAAHGEQAELWTRLEACHAEAELVALTKACLSPNAGDRPADAQAVAEAFTGYLASVQERLRQAELERTAAQARAAAEEQARAAAQAQAQAERQARRLLTGLAAAVVALVLLGGGGWLWRERERATRREETSQGVNRELGKAEQLAEQARAATEIPTAVSFWDQALKAVEQAAEVQAAGLAEPAAQQRVAELRQQMEQALAGARQRLAQERKDARLLADLDQARLAGGTAVADHFDRAAMLRGYEEALRRYGIDVAAGEPQELAARLRVCSPAVVPQLVWTLDHWALWTGPGRLRQRLRQAAQEADQEPRRKRLRDAVADGRVEALHQLAREAQKEPLPAVVLELLGHALKEKGAIEEALILLRQAQQRHPADFWIHVDLAEVLYQTRGRGRNRLEEALGCYRAALALRPNVAGVNNNLGVVLKAKGDLDEAVAAYQKALDLDANDIRAQTNLGNALQAKGDLDGAITAYKKALDFDPNYALAYSNLGVALTVKHDLDGAITAYHKAIALDPEFALTYYNLGNTLKTKGDWAGAIAAYHKAIARAPSDVRAYSNLGLVLFDQGDLPGATAAFQKAIAIEPEVASAHNNLGMVLKTKGDLDGALAAFHKAIALDPSHVRAHWNLGVALLDRGDLTGAITAFQKAIALDPKFAPAHHSLSAALRTKGDWDGAVGAYHKAIALDPKNVWAHFNLGNALQAKGDLDGAIAAYQKAIGLNPKMAPAHNNLGNALANKGDWDGAIGAYQKAIALDPNYALAHCNLGDALFNKGELSRALAASQKAIALDPKLALAHNHLGNALRAQGDLDGAMAAYQKAIDLDFSCAQAHMNLGLTLGQRGQLTAALEALRRGHELGSRKPGWNSRSTQILERTQRLVTAETKLPDFLRGTAKPANAAEALTLTELCHLRKRYVAAVRFAAEALAAKPELGANPQTGLLDLAASAAVLAAAGQGIDAGDLSGEERGRLRQQALDWLRADLKAWTKRADQAGGRPQLRRTLLHWQKNPELASVREAKEQEKLPTADRQAWQRLWADVAALLERTR